ncbi:MAG: hypothetical protein U5K54_18780 [Cytophagales bacterium]|nr:hypothetical protein [Cytophagales bacterium]
MWELKGSIYAGAANIVDRKGKVMYQFDRTKEKTTPIRLNMINLFAAIAKKEFQFSDTEHGAMTTMTAILGRVATYTGQVVKFEKALNSGMTIVPTKFDFNAQPPIVPNKKGSSPVAIAGVTRNYFRRRH